MTTRYRTGISIRITAAERALYDALATAHRLSHGEIYRRGLMASVQSSDDPDVHAACQDMQREAAS